MIPSLLAPLLILGATLTPVDSVLIVLPSPPTEALERVGAILSRQLTSRADVQVVASGDADFTISLATDATLPEEGYRVSDASSEGVRIAGRDALSALYGVGKFLRTSRFEGERFTPGNWRGESAPEGKFRAIYAATHFNNFYEAAPAEEVVRYLEDLALWGANAVILHFPTWSFEGYDDPKARTNLNQIRRLLEAANGIGMKTGLVQCPNQGFTAAPDSVRATPNPDELKRRGNTGINCCPSTPEGEAYLLKVYEDLFAEYKDVGLDYLVCWPYDEGGCGCRVCAPWGAKAYPNLSQKVAELGREVFPDLEVILSTWMYDVPPEGEWPGLTERLREDHAWLNAIMADDHFDFPRYPLDHGVPGDLPLYNFPEISMWGRNPWGAYGANPLPARYEGLWKQVQGRVSGGMPYSEGIFEDINKAICLRFYWNGEATAESTLREYAAFEFSPDVVVDVVQAVLLLEEAWVERGPKSVEAFELLRKADAALPKRVRSSWRWRLLYLRGLIDSQMAKNGGKKEGDVLRDAFNELTALYHADRAHPSLRPPVIP